MCTITSCFAGLNPWHMTASWRCRRSRCRARGKQISYFFEGRSRPEPTPSLSRRPIHLTACLLTCPSCPVCAGPHRFFQFRWSMVLLPQSSRFAALSGVLPRPPMLARARATLRASGIHTSRGDELSGKLFVLTGSRECRVSRGPS